MPPAGEALALPAGVVAAAAGRGSVVASFAAAFTFAFQASCSAALNVPEFASLLRQY